MAISPDLTRLPSIQDLEIYAHPSLVRSVFQLARRCQFEEAHALTVARLATSLFDQLGELGLHRYGPAERELLYFAAILHDIGGFISYTDHHRHGYYLVRFSPLLGFDGTEIRMLAAIVLHHRKGLPKRKEEAMADLSRVGIHDRSDLQALALGDESDLRRFVGQARFHQDDWPILEFTAPLSLARDRSAEIVEELRRP